MRPIAIDDFCAVRSLANVTFSPEGTTACFTVSQAKKEKNCYDSRLYTLKDGVVRALTSGGKESSFCYLDENTVLFAADREGEKEPSLQSRFYRIALDGGEDGLMFYRAIVRHWTQILRPGGWLMFEVGEDQADAVMALMTEEKYTDVTALEDTAGIRRVVVGRI